MKTNICFNTDCFRFDENSISISCCYTDSCNGYQISATKQLLKELKKEGAINSETSHNNDFNKVCPTCELLYKYLLNKDLLLDFIWSLSDKGKPIPKS